MNMISPPLISQSKPLLGKRVKQEWLVCETIDGRGFHRDHLNPSRGEAGTLHVSHVTEPHYTHASASRTLSLKCLLHWASGRNRSKMTAVRSRLMESSVDLRASTPVWSTWSQDAWLSCQIHLTPDCFGWGFGVCFVFFVWFLTKLCFENGIQE